ncbi:MAG: hypothetical protein JO256_12475 [Alphaproteobacteria bacterium]|nr:hypothetical protein [Alphaproteobacteria bacterium]
MFKEKPNKWTRERSFLEVNGGDILMLMTALFFLALTVGGFYVLLFHPRIPGLAELFSDAPPGPPPDQKLHLAPGETEIKLYPLKPATPPPQQKK